MKRLLITAGPTHEPIDAVRYIANRSSGKTGAALAGAARDAGWEVRLLLGPVEVGDFPAVAVHRFVTTADLGGQLEEYFPKCDVLVMAAAVADYRPTRPTSSKLPRVEQGLSLKLEPTPDLVAGCVARKRPGQRVVGFALEEPSKLDSRAVEKLRVKGLDAIVANPLHTMSSDSIEAHLIFADGRRLSPGEMGKGEFAAWLVSRLDEMVA